MFVLIDDFNITECIPQIMNSLQNTTSSANATNILPCFNNVFFKNIQDFNFTSSSTLTDLFYRTLRPGVLDYTHMLLMRPNEIPIRIDGFNTIYNLTKTEYFWIIGSMTFDKLNDHFERNSYYIHSNALYRINSYCFKMFLERVQEEYPEMRFDMAMHLYRTDFENFRVAQHTNHLFRYSKLFLISKDPFSEIKNFNMDNSPQTYFYVASSMSNNTSKYHIKQKLLSVQ